MSDPSTNTPSDTNSFTLSIRLLGNELFAFSISISHFTNKWLAGSLASLFMVLVLLNMYGGTLLHIYKSATGH